MNRKWLQTNRWLQGVFLALLVFTLFLGTREFLYQLPRIRVLLHLEPRLTKKEEALLQNLTKSLTQEGYNQVREEGKKLAKGASVVEVGRCRPNPPILRVKRNAVQIFRNSDTKKHTLSFTVTKELVLPPLSTRSLKIDFYQYIPGIFLYVCDGKRQGAIYITDE